MEKFHGIIFLRKILIFKIFFVKIYWLVSAVPTGAAGENFEKLVLFLKKIGNCSTWELVLGAGGPDRGRREKFWKFRPDFLQKIGHFLNKIFPNLQNQDKIRTEVGNQNKSWQIRTFSFCQIWTPQIRTFLINQNRSEPCF